MHRCSGMNDIILSTHERCSFMKTEVLLSEQKFVLMQVNGTLALNQKYLLNGILSGCILSIVLVVAFFALSFLHLFK